MSSKVCTFCGELKPLDDFYKKPKRSDGRDSRCKPCHNRYTEDHRNPERARERKREYDRRTPERKREKNRRYRDKNPEKVRAGWLLRRAVKDGRLVRPEACLKCGRRGRVEAHHADYSKPLDVEWLCRKCHEAEHRVPALSSGVRQGGSSVAR